jgi:ribosomal protein S18 acetylase RimI-like enzyme
MSLATALPESLFFDLVSAEEVEAVHELEVQGRRTSVLPYVPFVTVRFQGFHPRKLLPLSNYGVFTFFISILDVYRDITFSLRQKNAPDLFLGAFVSQTGGKRDLLGYIDGVLSSEATLTSESMSTHVPGARTVLIHGVCVSSDARRRGIASALLAEYLRRLAAAGSHERALLITHEDKVAFYERVGFRSRGLSSISFAGVPWHELEWVVPLERPSEPQDVPQAIPSGLLQALQGQGASPRRQGQLLSSFQDGVHAVSEKGDQKSNSYDLLCVNERCGSIILKQGVASLRERESVQVSILSHVSVGLTWTLLAQMEPVGIIHPNLPALPPPPDKTHWWLVTPSPMLFENIGFSKPTHTGSPTFSSNNPSSYT